MAVREILKLPDPMLRQVSSPVVRVNHETRALMDDMLATMYAAPGIGLAAIQIGVPLRIVVADLAREDEERKPLHLVNPEIIQASEDVSEYEEGCLSIPEFFDMVSRPKCVTVRYLDRDGERHELDCEGVLATCLQHEIDHLNGVLFIDHLSRLKRDRVVKKFTKAQKLARVGA
ncbi:peptide deformylase [soil metagenome]